MERRPSEDAGLLQVVDARSPPPRARDCGYWVRILIVFTNWGPALSLYLGS